MSDNIEHQDKGELVANCDQLQNDEVVVDDSAVSVPHVAL